MPKLGVNIDHVATLRQARREEAPDPVAAARLCEQSGAHSIVAHLREDRRHIQDKDIHKLRKIIKTKFNMEMSAAEEIVKIALKLKPDQATLVPEKRQEITTEGGLDVITNFKRLRSVVRRLQKKGIAVSLFIDPDRDQIKKAKETGAAMIELHTGTYARAKSETSTRHELKKLRTSARLARNLGLVVAAGHGLNYKNAKAVASIPEIVEFNIGHAIVSYAVFAGLKPAVKKMLRIIQ